MQRNLNVILKIVEKLIQQLKSLLHFKAQPTKKDIMNAFFSLVVKDATLGDPRYCPNVKSEDYAHENQYHLHVTDIWNANLNTGAFSISINGFIVGSILESVCSRDNPNFQSIRDEIMSILSKLGTATVVEMCQQSGLPPSRLFQTWH